MTQQDLNRYLMGLLGSEAFVKRWWYSPNVHFKFDCPQEVWDGGDEGKREVISYVMGHAMMGGGS